MTIAIDPRYLFVVVYLIVDILYVTTAQDAYKRIVSSITKDRAPVFNMAAGALAYLIMAVSWLFFVPPMIATLQKTYHISRTLAGAIVGMMMGVAIYGVFNFTNRAMFEKWASPIMIQDLMWGISWLTILSATYGYFSK